MECMFSVTVFMEMVIFNCEKATSYPYCMKARKTYLIYITNPALILKKTQQTLFLIETWYMLNRWNYFNIGLKTTY